MVERERAREGEILAIRVCLCVCVCVASTFLLANINCIHLTGCLSAVSFKHKGSFQ